MNTETDDVSQDVFDEVTAYFKENPEKIAQAAVNVADSLIESGWDLSEDADDPWDAGFTSGVIFGFILNGVHESGLLNGEDAPGDLSRLHRIK